MAFRRLCSLSRTSNIPPFHSLIGSSRSYSSRISRVLDHNSWSISSCLCNGKNAPHGLDGRMILHSTMAAQLAILSGHKRLFATQIKAPPQARPMGAVKVALFSPGIIYEPYIPRERISFLKRYFTRDGWKRTKEDIISELKSAYAIAKLRKTGYSKADFYKEAVDIYKEINSLVAAGDKTSLRKAVTENMYSALKNEIKQRESVWSEVYWELIEPIVKIRTVRARLIGVDRNDTSKVFIQLTLDLLSKQKFEARDSKRAVVSGDKNKEVLVRDIWVYEKSLFHPGAYWRLCGRIKV